MINVKPVPAITLLIIFSLLIWVAFGGGCKDEVEAYEPEEPRGITFKEPIGESIFLTDPNGGIAFAMPESNDIAIIYIEPEITDLMFAFTNSKGVEETLTINIVDNEIVCSQPAEKAIEIIYKTMWKTWGITPLIDIDDFPVRFLEPSEPECKK